MPQFPPRAGLRSYPQESPPRLGDVFDRSGGAVHHPRDRHPALRQRSGFDVFLERFGLDLPHPPFGDPHQAGDLSSALTPSQIEQHSTAGAP